MTHVLHAVSFTFSAIAKKEEIQRCFDVHWRKCIQRVYMTVYT